MKVQCNKADVCVIDICPHRAIHSTDGFEYEEETDEGDFALTCSCFDETTCPQFPGETVTCLEVKEKD